MQSPKQISESLSSKLKQLREKELYREFITLERLARKAPFALHHRPEGSREVLLWCHNDYLGLGQHPQVLNSMHIALDQYGAGAGGTRNIAGTHNSLVALEKEIAQLHQKEAGLVFTSGFVGNEAALGVLGRSIPNVHIFSDELNHASMIQGIRLSKAPKHIFRHNDIAHLRALLATAPEPSSKIIALESVYSMDGDVAPLEAIVEIAQEFDAFIYLDEVHAVGLYGEDGSGYAKALGLEDEIHLILGTLGKAFGTLGGYIASDRVTVDAIRSLAPEFIFTTSLPPVITEGARKAISLSRFASDRRERLHTNSFWLKQAFIDRGLPLYGYESHILPLQVGDEKSCRELARQLLWDFGHYTQPICFPTVPLGKARLRITPGPDHTEEMMISFLSALEVVWEKNRSYITV